MIVKLVPLVKAYIPAPLVVVTRLLAVIVVSPVPVFFAIIPPVPAEIVVALTVT